MTVAYTERFDAAVNLAVTSFRRKFRKQTKVPYITHLFMVCAIVGEHGGDEDQMIAAVLHDYLEDIEGSSPEQLERDFGKRVCDLVLALSDTIETPKPPWKPRKEKYLAHLRHEPADVKLISAADKLHNCRTVVQDHHVIGDRIFDRFTAPKHETLWYFRSVLGALETNWKHPILADLHDSVRALHRVAEVPM